MSPRYFQLCRDLVNELGPLLVHGFKFPDNSSKSIVLEFIVCDLPAVAKVKSIIGHTGYASCPKCTVRGQYLNSRMTFIPAVHNRRVLQRRFLSEKELAEKKNPSMPVQLRTDESFRAESDKLHHHKKKSPFLELKIDMVNVFTIDGMHTVFAGVVRRFLHFLQHSKRNVDPDDEQNKKQQKRKEKENDNMPKKGSPRRNMSEI